MAKGSLDDYLLVLLLKENVCVTTRPIDFVTSFSIVHIWIFLLITSKWTKERDFSKHCPLYRLIIKLMQEKVKVWWHSLQQKFSNFEDNSKFTFTVIIIFFLRLHFYNYYNFMMEWWFVKLQSYIMSSKAEPFRLRLHGIGYVQICLGSDPLCLHGTGSKLEQYGST